MTHALLDSERLTLRRWTDADREPFAELNADPEVMEYFPSTLTRAESDRLMDRIEAEIVANGFGFWAVERRTDGALLGFTGIGRPSFDAPFMPCVEVAWRLRRDAWGYGYATEAARAAVAHGFTFPDIDEIVAFATAPNARSQAVMQRLGMTHDPADDFDHPAVPNGNPLRRHVLYRLARPSAA